MAVISWPVLKLSRLVRLRSFQRWGFKSWCLLCSFLLAQGAPLGFMVVQLAIHNAAGPSIIERVEHIAAVHTITLVYMWAGTTGAFCLFGYAMGSLADHFVTIDKEKDRLVGITAHDLRSPIANISTFGELLQKSCGDKLTESENFMLGRIRVLSTFMLDLISDVLNLSRIESGKLDMRLAPGDLSHVLETSLDLNSPVAAHKNITLKHNYPQHMPLRELDSHKMTQAVGNLISNAIKFSHAGTCVTVTAYQEDARTVIEVSDQGQGIPEAEFGKLFRPFERTSVRSTAGEGSTGLGLFIVKEIVEGHGGTVSVTSAPGIGSTFRIDLPQAGKD